MFWNKEIKFPPRNNSSVEDDLKQQRQDGAMTSTGSSVVYATWDDIFQKRPLDTPFYTSLNGRATILIYFSSQSVPNKEILSEVMESKRPWIFHAAAFINASYPILRTHILFPDNPRDPFYMETPLDVRGGDVQDFCNAFVSKEYIDIAIKHEHQLDGYYIAAFHGSGGASVLEKQVKKVLKKLKTTDTKADFKAGVKQMKAVFSSPTDGIDRANCIPLKFFGEAQNRMMIYGEK